MRNQLSIDLFCNKLSWKCSSIPISGAVSRSLSISFHYWRGHSPWLHRSMTRERARVAVAVKARSFECSGFKFDVPFLPWNILERKSQAAWKSFILLYIHILWLYSWYTIWNSANFFSLGPSVSSRSRSSSATFALCQSSCRPGIRAEDVEISVKPLVDGLYWLSQPWVIYGM